jgi:hypothetical protein
MIIIEQGRAIIVSTYLLIAGLVVSWLDTITMIYWILFTWFRIVPSVWVG